MIILYITLSPPPLYVWEGGAGGVSGTCLLSWLSHCNARIHARLPRISPPSPSLKICMARTSHVSFTAVCLFVTPPTLILKSEFSKLSNKRQNITKIGIFYCTVCGEIFSQPKRSIIIETALLAVWIKPQKNKKLLNWHQPISDILFRMYKLLR
jgi:hypothetical protein